MTIEEPPKEVMDAVDWGRVHELEERARELASKGPIPHDVYRAMWSEGLKATKGHRAFLDLLLVYEPEGLEL